MGQVFIKLREYWKYICFVWNLGSIISLNNLKPPIVYHCRGTVWEEGACGYSPSSSLSQTGLCGHWLPLYACDRRFTLNSQRYSAGAGLHREDQMHEVMRAASCSEPCLLAVIWGSSLSHRFSCWSFCTDCTISCDGLYAEGWQIEYLRLRFYCSQRFAFVHLFYTESRLANSPWPVSSQSALFLGMPSDKVHFNGLLGRAWAYLVVGYSSTVALRL